MYELIYTSTRSGLIVGRSGFTTVALTAGFPKNLIAPVENLSGYKPLYLPGDEHERCNPVNYSFQKFTLGKTPYMVLSKISYAGLSYTGRSNILAHHLIFSPEELNEIPGGPVSVLFAEENFPPWSGNARMLPQKSKISVRASRGLTGKWGEITGDPGWAQYIAESYRSNPEKKITVSFDPLQISGTDMLELIAEITSYLTPEEALRFTFSTYHYSSSIVNPLVFRAFVNSSVQLSSIKRLDPESIIYLEKGNVLPESYRVESKCQPEVEPETYPEVEETDPESSEDCSQIQISQLTEDMEQIYDMQPESVEPLKTINVDNRNSYHYHDDNDNDNNDDCDDAAIIRKRILLALAAAVILGLCAVVFWRIFSEDTAAGESERIEETHILLKPESPVKKTAMKEKRDKRTQVVTTSVKKEQTEMQDPVSVRKKTEEVKKTAAEHQTTEFKPSKKEIFALYYSFYGKKTVMLPGNLKAATALNLEIDSLGGQKDSIILSDYITGNNTRRVTVKGRLWKNSGFGEWVPDTNAVRKEMMFELTPEGCFKMRFPKDIGAAPLLSDIVRISFCLPNGKRLFSITRELPGCIDGILNQEIRSNLKVKKEGAYIKFYLDVPDEFWVFREYYTIHFNNRSIGNSIEQREILLDEINMNPLQKLLTNRNILLCKYKETGEEFNKFIEENIRQPISVADIASGLSIYTGIFLPLNQI